MEGYELSFEHIKYKLMARHPGKVTREIGQDAKFDGGRQVSSRGAD